MEFNLALVHDAIARAYPDRECIVWGDRRFTYGDVAERTRRLANGLRDRGLGIQRERAQLAGHESGQDHLALYLYNGNEYLEGMLGAFRARVAPFNVNYRYVAEELRYLLNDAGARGIVYHACFAPTLAEVLPDLPELDVLVQVADDSGDGAARRRGRLRAACWPTSSDEASLDDLVARRPLHPLHRRHHRHAEGRAVAPARHLRRRHGRPALRRRRRVHVLRRRSSRAPGAAGSR